MIFFNMKSKIVFYTMIISCLAFFDLADLQAQDSSMVDRFSYNGEVLYRGYYLWRDILIPSRSLEKGEPKIEQSWTDYHICNALPEQCKNLNQTRQREEEDFSTIRLRLNMAFRPSSYADVLYAIEVGHLTFGRESSTSGPGSGGRGSGRVNIETRELLLRLHNQSQELIGDVGIYNFSTPSGIVVATSGAGGRVKYDLNSIRSSFELNYIHSVDQSRVDGDSNGFSDDNFSDNRMVVLNWKASFPQYVKSEIYSVFRSDDDPTRDDPTEENRETSNVYWAGLYLGFQFGQFGVLLHGIGNWGHFSRLLNQDPQINKVLNDKDDPLNEFYTEAVKPPLRKKYDINAGAGQIELSWELNDSINLALVGSGASGRIPGDEELDGSSIDFRPDQFRHAGTSFSYTDIALDDSGGYSIFKGGQLTGVTVGGLRFHWQIDPAIAWKVAWYKLRAFRTPNLHKNSNYLLYNDTMKASNELGEEWNTKLIWEPFLDFSVTTNFGWFNASKGYKGLYDIEYGDDIYEFSVFVKQKF